MTSHQEIQISLRLATNNPSIYYMRIADEFSLVPAILIACVESTAIYGYPDTFYSDITKAISELFSNRTELVSVVQFLQSCFQYIVQSRDLTYIDTLLQDTNFMNLMAYIEPLAVDCMKTKLFAVIDKVRLAFKFLRIHLSLKRNNGNVIEFYRENAIKLYLVQIENYFQILYPFDISNNSIFSVINQHPVNAEGNYNYETTSTHNCSAGTHQLYSKEKSLTMKFVPFYNEGVIALEPVVATGLFTDTKTENIYTTEIQTTNRCFYCRKDDHLMKIECKHRSYNTEQMKCRLCRQVISPSCNNKGFCEKCPRFASLFGLEISKNWYLIEVSCTESLQNPQTSCIHCFKYFHKMSKGSTKDSQIERIYRLIKSIKV